MANLIIKPTSGGSLILQDEGGTAAHTIDASGNHTLSGTTNNLGTVTAGTIASGVTGGAGLTEAGITHASQWWMTTNFTGDADPITANLVEVNAPTGFGKIGASMTVSSGIFTFPVTGYWLIVYNWQGFDVNDSLSVNPQVYTTHDNSTWGLAVHMQQGSNVTSTTYHNQEGKYIMDVTSTSTHKVKFRVMSTVSGSQTMGSSTYTRTGFTFIRLGAT